MKVKKLIEMRRGNFRPWGNRGGFSGFTRPKDKPLFTVDSRSRGLMGDVSSDEDDNQRQMPNEPAISDVSYTTDKEPGACVGWKLYFPDNSE